ncbi:hypothetical protein [Micromonospora sp. NPDC023633]|uniref:hypothetical protein n=1 Tax=Micromonospora sp. NPDC023633 TaxID=3154320 RepID=UPI0033D47569
MTHRVSAIDDHRRIVPGRGSAAGGRTPAPPAGRRAAAQSPRPAAPATGRARAAYR